MKKKISAFLLSTTLLFSLLFSACSATPPSGVFAGKVDGSDALLSIVLHTDGTVTAYVCDSVTVSEWFKGSVSGNTLSLTNATGATLTATTATESFSGTFTPAGGSALNFSVSVVEEPAGLYRLEETVDGVDYVTGWVVLADGDTRGATSGGGKILPPPNLNPKTVPGASWTDPTPFPATGSTPGSE